MVLWLNLITLETGQSPPFSSWIWKIKGWCYTQDGPAYSHFWLYACWLPNRL